ncbi:hypothetical protein [uncultured Sneathiella sp.]|uniref:hypothetical protein n=1 Tax=uncultured Sneathiella sp. TaxID=879315 RepID=UPI0030EF58E7|tara:strand:+ start:1057 stop:2163 length:1107 start_codon:yes stop_codon:yes gene_type:complete
MSDNPNDSSNQNDPNDEEKKDDYSDIAGPKKDKNDPAPNFFENSRPLESVHFLRNSELIFGYVDEIYKSNKTDFASDNFDFYTFFLNSFHPGKALPNQASVKQQIQKAISKILLLQQNPDNQATLWNNLENKKVSGFLHVGIQLPTASSNFLGVKEFNKHMDIEGSYSDLENANICFSITTPRSLEEYKSITETSRIVIHLSISPETFWQSEMALNLVKELQKFPFIFQFKVRDTKNFNKADSIVIYSAIDYEETWKQIGKIVTKIIPANCRTDYTLPFATSLEKGIVANIPIDLFVPNISAVKICSFTEGLGIMSRWAYMMAMNTAPHYLDDRLSIFQGILAAIFNKNKLIVTKDGMLSQPERLGKK